MPDTLTLKKLTPVLVVEAVEPSLAFFERRIGFTKTVEVPHDGKLGFAILVRDGVELMLQSEASVRADMGFTTGRVVGGSAALYLEVSDLDAIERALDGMRLVLARRKTFYGAEEVGVVEPGGHFIVFAQPVKG
jgi:uncharacterized glyoxalase superfamily protein PhnB